MSTVVSVPTPIQRPLKAAAVKHAVDKGILMSMDSNDFDSMDHTDGHLMASFPGNGSPDIEGRPAQTFRPART